MINCLICNEEIKNFIALGLHLKNKHNISSKDYYDTYFKKENEGICSECGKETSFQGIKRGYLKFCCPTCAQLNKDTRQKYKNTCKKIYGVENTFQAEVCKEKAKTTCLKNNGVEYPQQSKQIQLKSKQTKFKKYGNENYNNVDKAQQTCLQNWGVTSYSKTDQFKSALTQQVNFKEVAKKGLITKAKITAEMCESGYIPLQDVFKLYGESWYKNKIANIVYKGGTGFISNVELKIIDQYYHSTSGHSSQEETKLFNIIKTYYNGEIIRGDYNILNGLELDFYFPKLALAIEYNGTYWHSITFKSIDYHFYKSISCFNKGIRLIHFYGYESFDSIETFIQNVFNHTEQATNDFNKFSPLQFTKNKNIKFSGPKLLDSNTKELIYGAGTFTLL